MTTEISRGKSRYIYRAKPGDPLTVERRDNKAGARWYFYLHRDTASEARAALLQLERPFATGNGADAP